MDGSVKIMASGPEDVISEFIRDLEMDHPDTTRNYGDCGRYLITVSIWQDRTDDIREYMPRFDRGIVILEEHTEILKEHTS